MGMDGWAAGEGQGRASRPGGKAGSTVRRPGFWKLKTGNAEE